MMLKSSRYSKQNGFTLIEAIISLLIVGLIIHAIQSTFITYKQFYIQQEQDRLLDWQQFLILLEKELNVYRVEKVYDNYLRIAEIASPHKQELIVLNRETIYKTSYQPLLFGVNQWQLTQFDNQLFISAKLTNNQWYSGVISFDP